MNGVPGSGYTGTIQSGGYAMYALDAFEGPIQLENCRFCYCQVAVYLNSFFYPNVGVSLYDCQIVNSECGVQNGWGTNGYVLLENCLFAYDNAASEDWGSSGDNLYCYDSTFDNCGSIYSYIAEGSTNEVVVGVNSIFSNSGLGDGPNYGSYNGFYNCGGTFGDPAFTDNSTPYQGIVGGNYYLANVANHPFRGVGTTNIDQATQNAGFSDLGVASTIVTDLATKTTWPPILYNGATFATNATFNPWAPRDTNSSPDIGYHYDPLDYIFENNCQVYSNVTFTAGTAAAWTTSEGIQLEKELTVNFAGLVTSPDYWVRCNTVQEDDPNGSYGPGGLVSEYSYGTLSAAPTAEASFTRFSMLAGYGNPFRDDYGELYINMKDCEFWDTGEGGYGVGLNLTNCLFYRTYVGADSTGPAEMAMQNCTMYGGSIFTSHSDSSSWPDTFVNCSFDGGADLSGVDKVTYCDYNAFLANGSRFPISGPHDINVTNGFNWQSGWFGQFYLPSDSPLIYHGSTNANYLGLYHYTTITNLVNGLEVPDGTNIVTIGYHYVATDQYGNPLDSNGDGIPDYLEDANGDGIYDAGDLAAWNVVPDYSVPAAWYEANGLDPNNPLIGIQDPDWDGLLNQQEYLYGTNPQISEGFGVWVSTPNGTSSIP